MIKVKQIGERRLVTNPITKAETEMQVVTFTEEGRGGLSGSLAGTSAFLDSVLGVKTGLDNIRTHTQLLTLEAVAKIKVGDEIPGHINRTLTTFASMRQQMDVAARSVDGRPTYVYTRIDADAQEDVDQRVSNEALLKYDQGSILFSARLGGTEVRVVRNPAASMEEVIAGGTV